MSRPEDMVRDEGARLIEAYWRRWLARRTPHVRDRILRFNPTVPHPGSTIRGWQPSRRFSGPDLSVCATLARRDVLREFGREGWEVIRAAGAVRRYGRRHFVTTRDYARLRISMAEAKQAAGAHP